MKRNRILAFRAVLVVTVMLIATLGSSRLGADTGTCGGASISLPFTDVMGNIFFCQIAEAYFSGLTNGTTATTYSPSSSVTREQMAAFVTRTMDQALRRGSRRAVLKQFWTPGSADGLGLTTVGSFPSLVASDGSDLWVANNGGTVSRVRASDGKLLETWTGANQANGVVVAKGLVFVTGYPSNLYQIDPTQSAGAVTTLPISLGSLPQGIAFDGARIWTANNDASVSIVTLSPLSVNTFAGFDNLIGIVFDGSNMWVTGGDKLVKLDSNGAIIQTVTVGTFPGFPVFDGTNIWVPNYLSNSVTVIRASTGAVVATLTGNGLFNPQAVAFDGERILVTNQSGSRVSLWKAADLSPIGSVGTGASTNPYGACSDGHHFWVTLLTAGKLARF